jgi:hypothetical protein
MHSRKQTKPIQEVDSKLWLLVTYSVIPIVAVMHMIQGLIMFFSDESIGATPLSELLYIFNSRFIVSELLILGVPLTLFAVFWPHLSRFYRFLLMLPQQTFVTVSAFGAIQAMLLGSYADGTIRSSWFIVGDQIPIVMLAVAHSVAVITRALQS